MDALKSVTEETSITSFINETKLLGARFEAQREESLKLIDDSNRLNLLTPTKEYETRLRNENLKKFLSIPRRPPWDKSITHELQITNENKAFLLWRRKMADLEDKTGLIMTPFERNLEVWRQLWRVVEKSDLLLQIVDCRNPLLFMSTDLQEYAREVDKSKKCITIMNKSDLLTDEQRAVWAKYFNENNIEYIFYSALQALKNAEEGPGHTSSHAQASETNDDIGIRPAFELLNFINKQASELNISNRKVVVGFVGYPNVGKSSTINSLVGKKCQSVSSTPGKTKHFQTIHLSDTIIICDCPGLVFPSLATTKAELVCNGILPIDQMRDYMSPCALVVRRLPMEVLENIYNVKVPKYNEIPLNEGLLEISTRNFLRAHALSRGFTKSTQGNPDESRSARYILKDYVNAKIIWCQPPPELDELEFNKYHLPPPSLNTNTPAKDPSSKETKAPRPDLRQHNQKVDSGVEHKQAYVVSKGVSNNFHIVFDESKKAHKNNRRRQVKQRIFWTKDPFQ